MTFRLRITKALIWINCILFAFILGGNLYEQSVIVAYWADNPPETLQFWRDIMKSGHFTFYALTPISILTAITSLIFAWNDRRLRLLVGISVVSIILVLVITLLFALPLLKQLFPQELQGSSASVDYDSVIREFKMLSWFRWAILFAGFITFLRALTIAGTTSAS